MVFKLFQSIEYSQLYHIIYILIILTILNNIVKNRSIKHHFLDTYMMIYITVFRFIYVKVINYTYFLIKKNRIHFFYDKTSGARPIKQYKLYNRAIIFKEFYRYYISKFMNL